MGQTSHAARILSPESLKKKESQSIKSNQLRNGTTAAQ